MPVSSAIQQSLNALLPTYSQKLPAKLTHLSESLLAQSRQRASQLKPDEEIARTYACCEIACKRLRAQCRLPAVKAGGAPCKPAVYKKLVTFLERVLDEDTSAATTPKSTPGGRKRGADGNPKLASSASNTPSKTPVRQTNAFLGKLKASATKSNAQNDDTTEAPAFVMPSIRKLCRTFTTPLLAPHVYTGTSIVLKLAGLWPREEQGSTADYESWAEDVTGLLIALYLMTLTRMMTAKMTTSVYKTTCAKAVDEVNYKPGAAAVEAWIRRINREGYCGTQDWWMSVPESVFDFDPSRKKPGTVLGRETAGADGNEEEEEEEEHIILSSKKRRKDGGKALETSQEEDDPEGVLLPGLLTMMQDAVDFLSEERTHHYDTWKRQFLRKLDRLDKTPAAGGGRAIAAK